MALPKYLNLRRIFIDSATIISSMTQAESRRYYVASARSRFIYLIFFSFFVYEIAFKVGYYNFVLNTITSTFYLPAYSLTNLILPSCSSYQLTASNTLNTQWMECDSQRALIFLILALTWTILVAFVADKLLSKYKSYGKPI